MAGSRYTEAGEYGDGDVDMKKDHVFAKVQKCIKRIKLSTV